MRLPDLSRFRRQAKAALTREEALAARPLRNPAITWEEQDNGRVLLIVPLEQKAWLRLLRLLVRIPTEKKVELDELGSDVWRWSDGEATVDDLVARLSQKHKLHRREAETSLTQFLQTLAQRRFMGFAVKVDEERAKELGAEVAKPHPEVEADSPTEAG